MAGEISWHEESVSGEKRRKLIIVNINRQNCMKYRKSIFGGAAKMKAAWRQSASA